MSGMPLFQAFVFLASAIIIIAATQPHRFHPFLALVVIASAFGLAAGFSVGFVGKAFGNGFSQTIYSPGLVVVAVALVAGLADSISASNRLAALADRWRWLGSTRLTALLGLIAGVGALPATAFALLTPLQRSIAGGTGPLRQTATITLALAISASHGLVLFSPVMIAAASILDAGWGRVALFGLPVAVIVVACGAVWARWVPTIDAAQPLPKQQQAATQVGSSSAIVVFAATAVPLLMLMFQSFGDIPSEPLGGGGSREMVLGVGRPLILFLVAIGIMIVGHWRQSLKLLTDSNWTGSILAKVAGVLLIIGAAGGFQRLCQETGMAELLGERLLAWPAGLLVPFVVAALIKTLQGSSLVAAITTAGMIQPLLISLGIADESGKALAALAIGAGAMTISHVNDEYFWLVTVSAGLSPLRGLAKFTVGTLLQGVIAAAALLILSVLVPRF